MKDFTLFSDYDESTYLDDVSGLTVPEYLLEKASQAVLEGKDSWIIDAISGESHSFSEFEALTRRVGSSMYKRGMRKGDTVIHMTSDPLHTPIFLAGVWRANGIIRVSYPEDNESTLLDRVDESRAGWILCDPEASKMCLSLATSVNWDVEVIVIGKAEGCTSLQDLLSDDGSELPPLSVTSEDTLLILCTSGTTGKSKGAEHSHSGLVNQFETMKCIPLPTEKSNLIVAKPTHVNGLQIPFIALSKGITILTLSKTNNEALFQAVDKYRPGFVWGFPPFLLSLVNDPNAKKYDFSSMEVIGTGGTAATTAIQDALMQLPNVKMVFNGYGLTEVSPVAWQIDWGSTSTMEKFQGVPENSVGKIGPGIMLQIRDPKTREILGPNAQGEICVKSKCLFKSYYKNPEATAKAFIDGFFLTGDCGYYDDNGFVCIVDRLKEIFKYYNNHISPTELEDIIGKHPAVAEVCVVGIPAPDGGGHIPRAFITVKADVESDKELTTKIQNFANVQVAEYKHIKGGVYIVPELPKGKTGKVTRQLVAQLQVPE